MEKKILLLGLAFGILAIVLGAFGAHLLKKTLTLSQLNSFEIGVKYLMYHALFLIFVASTSWLHLDQKNIVFYLVSTGVLFFSGSIFLLTTQSLTKINFSFLGPITPLGGLLLIAAWSCVFVNILNKK